METSGRSVNWGARIDRMPVRLDAFSDASLVLETGESAAWRQVESAREFRNEAVGLREDVWLVLPGICISGGGPEPRTNVGRFSESEPDYET